MIFNGYIATELCVRFGCTTGYASIQNLQLINLQLRESHHYMRKYEKERSSDCMRPQSRLPRALVWAWQGTKRKRKTHTHNYTHTITMIITILANYISSSDTTLYIVSP